MKYIEINPNSMKFYDESWEKFLNLFRPNYFCESTVVEVKTKEKINGKTFTDTRKMYWYDIPKLWDSDFENVITIKFALVDYFGNVIADSIDGTEGDEFDEFIEFEIKSEDKVGFNRKHNYESKVSFRLSGDYCSFIEDLIELMRTEDIADDWNFEV